MAAFRSMAATVAALALVGYVQANEVPLPACLSPFQPFVLSGCFNQSDSTQQLLPFRSSLDQSNMTLEECMSECKGNDYRYAGLVYYGVCWCGQTVNGVQVDNSNCNLPCSGNSSETCGGNTAYSIYQDPTFPDASTVTIADYKSLGCWTDDSSLGRALSYQQNLDRGSLTTEGCLEACREGEFPFAGTEFSGECYCGVVIGNGTESAPSTDCAMPCSGNSSETCGGSSRLSLYVATELESLEPCGYVPPVSSSTTSTSTSSTTSSTSTSCTTSSVPTITTTSSTLTTSSTTTSSSACVSTSVVPPTCEYKCGNWCSTPLPNWGDSGSCKLAWSNCALQVSSCFAQAGWPDVLSCFDFGAWCSDVSGYCNTSPAGGCRKEDFCGKNPPKGGNPPKTVTVTTTCKPTTTPATSTHTSTHTTPATTSKCPVPTPTNICTQPSSQQYGYGPGNPVGGISLPVVTCNDLASDWPSYPFKCYNAPESRDCTRYPRSGCGSACSDACKQQYDHCVNVYAQGCKVRPSKPRAAEAEAEAEPANYFDFAGGKGLVSKRTFSWPDSYNGALAKCQAQYSGCLQVNKGVTGSGKCPAYNYW